MEQNKTVSKLAGAPNPARGPAPSRSFGDYYQRVLAVNKQFYRGKIPKEVLPLIQQYVETKFGMSTGAFTQEDMVLRVGDDPVAKAQGIVPNVGTGQPEQPK